MGLKKSLDEQTPRNSRPDHQTGARTRSTSHHLGPDRRRVRRGHRIPARVDSAKWRSGHGAITGRGSDSTLVRTDDAGWPVPPPMPESAMFTEFPEQRRPRSGRVHGPGREADAREMDRVDLAVWDRVKDRSSSRRLPTPVSSAWHEPVQVLPSSENRLTMVPGRQPPRRDDDEDAPDNEGDIMTDYRQPRTSAAWMPASSAAADHLPDDRPTSIRSASTQVKNPSTSPPHCRLPPWHGRNSRMKRTRKAASSTPMPTPASATTADSTPCAPPDGAAPDRSRTRTKSTADSSAPSTRSAAPPERSAKAKKPPASKSSSTPPTRAPSRPSAAGSETLHPVR